MAYVLSSPSKRKKSIEIGTRASKASPPFLGSAYYATHPFYLRTNWQNQYIKGRRPLPRVAFRACVRIRREASTDQGAWPRAQTLSRLIASGMPGLPTLQFVKGMRKTSLTLNTTVFLVPRGVGVAFECSCNLRCSTPPQMCKHLSPYDAVRRGDRCGSELRLAYTLLVYATMALEHRGVWVFSFLRFYCISSCFVFDYLN